MLSEDYHPWLIEINASPGMSPTSVEKCKLCSRVIDDTIRGMLLLLLLYYLCQIVIVNVIITVYRLAHSQ